MYAGRQHPQLAGNGPQALHRHIPCDADLAPVCSSNDTTAQEVESLRLPADVKMSMSFPEYCAAMVGCYSALPDHERAELHDWESEHVDGSGVCATSDWPGWEKHIGKF